jgi:hypothetical protein
LETTILKEDSLTLENIAAECQSGRRYAIIYKKEIELCVYFSLEGNILFCEMLDSKLPFTENNLSDVVKIEFSPRLNY